MYPLAMVESGRRRRPPRCPCPTKGVDGGAGGGGSAWTLVLHPAAFVLPPLFAFARCLVFAAVERLRSISFFAASTPLLTDPSTNDHLFGSGCNRVCKDHLQGEGDFKSKLFFYTTAT